MPREDEDSRFAAMHSSHLFKRSAQAKHKVKVDERFKEVLKDKKYVNVPGSVDKYGRKRKSKSAKEELKEFYTIEEDEEEEKVEKEKKPGVSMESRLDYLTKLSRGDISGDSSDDDSDDDSSSSDDDDEAEDELADSNAKSALAIDDDEVIEEEGGEATKRLAIQNCDWENLRAVDILNVLKSFCPAGRVIKSLNIYASDFGMKRMEEESKYGPQGIWDSSGIGADGDDDDDDDDDEEEVYTGIDKINDDDDDDDEDEEEGANKNSKKDKKGDFRRKSGNIGIVLQDDLVIRGKAKPDSDHSSAKREQESKRSTSSGKSSDYDIVALRKYELSKLRYYFAIAECDTTETANILYEQLDGVELEHSSMVFDLRFVPDDISFADRPIKDSCQAVPDNYKAPDFIVNALQHTSIECSWDEGEKEREKKLTNISSWRMLNESDFQQYIASSASESDDDDDDKTARIRKLLLGNDDGDDGDDHDDFFTKETNDDDEIANNDDEESDGMTFSYVPNVGKELLQRMKDREKQETPWEAKLRKMKEKKQARKMKKMDNKSDSDDDSDNLVGDEDDQVDPNDINNLEFSDDEADAKQKTKSSKTTKSKAKNTRIDTIDEERADGKKVASTDELEKLLGSKNHDTKEYDMRAIIKQEKLSKKKKKHRGDNTSSADDFQIDLQDDRFKALLDGDSRFGIDTTSAEYKETKAMKEVLKEQSKRRQQNRGTSDSAPAQKQDNQDTGNANKSIDQNLIDQLKRKFGNANNNQQKKKRV